MRSIAQALPIVALVLIAGCHGNDPAEHVPGLWKSAKGNFITFKHDFTFEQPAATHSMISGTWRIDSADVVITPVSMNGKPMAQVKATAVAFAQKRHYSQKLIHDLDDLDRPNYFSISPDGKTMKTDKSRDQNSGDPWELTKQGG